MQRFLRDLHHAVSLSRWSHIEFTHANTCKNYKMCVGASGIRDRGRGGREPEIVPVLPKKERLLLESAFWVAFFLRLWMTMGTCSALPRMMMVGTCSALPHRLCQQSIRVLLRDIVM